MEEETKIKKELFRIHERQREAAREEVLKKEKEDDERRKKFKPEGNARKAYRVQRMPTQSD